MIEKFIDFLLLDWGLYFVDVEMMFDYDFCMENVIDVGWNDDDVEFYWEVIINWIFCGFGVSFICYSFCILGIVYIDI